MAEEQHGRDPGDSDAGYSKHSEQRRTDNGYYRGQYSYRDHDGDRNAQRYWRRRRNRDYNHNYNHGYNYRQRDRDREYVILLKPETARTAVLSALTARCA